MDSNNMHYGMPQAANDSLPAKNGETLEGLVTGAPTNFSGGVSAGQQEPKSGS